MNFDASEEQELFTSTVERFTQGVDTEWRRKLRSHDGGYDGGRWKDLAELGLIALAASEDAGGMGGSPIDLALVAEALGRGNAPDPWLENGVLPARLLSAASLGDELEAVLSGEKFVACALAERKQRFNLKPVHMVVGDDGALTGEKTAVLGGGRADAFIVSADDKGEMQLFFVVAGGAGVEQRNYRVADGSMACELKLTRAAGQRLAVTQDQFDTIIDDVRLLAAAEMRGLAQRLLDDTLTYVKEREQFGVPIGSFQALQHRLVDCYSRVEQARSMLYRAALEDRSRPGSWHRAAAGAKAFIGAQADHVAREAVQMHGGMGVTDELSIGHAMKRVLVLNTLFGDGDAVLADYAKAA